jgi:pimeloyl-ACP methyl ester carboxylesterase
MENRAGKPTTYVLIHSAWLGGWAWQPLASILEQRGHKVIAPDLPGHGADKTPPAQVTMEAYLKTVTEILDAQDEPVVLVGHSLGGIVISQAAELRPDKVRALVYLCAFLLPLDGSFKKATEGVRSLVLDNLVMAADGGSVTIKEDVIHEALAHDVAEEAFAEARARIVPEPAAPLATPLASTEEGWGRIPRYYIECLADRAIPPEVQQAMYTAIPVKRRFSMKTSHAPNFSAPEELAGYLLEIAAE